ncbi:MAG: beta-ketoacyl-ACP synthase III [Anaerolineae bacterium]
MTQRYARITGWGKYVPAHRLTNYDLEQTIDTNDEWITSHTGIRERRIAAPGETAVDMALQASRAALERAKIQPEDLNLIVFATSTPDYLVPAAASLLQDRLGARGVAAFDLNAGCTGSVYALVTGSQFIRTGMYERVLVVGAEKLSVGIDYTDRNTAIMFGDGAGALVLEASNSPTGLLSFELGSDGAQWDALYCPGGGSANPFSEKVLNEREHYLRMDGKRVYKFVAKTITRSIQNVVESSGLPFSEIDYLIPHQSNIRIVEMIASRLKFDLSKVMVNLDRYGNTSSAAIPMAIADAADQGKITEGDHIVLTGFGAGMTWGSAVLHWEPTKPAEEQEAILVENWPIREALQLQANKMRAAVWSAQVTARTKAQEASMSVMLPFYTWQRKRKKAKEQQEGDASGDQS